MDWSILKIMCMTIENKGKNRSIKKDTQSMFLKTKLKKRTKKIDEKIEIKQKCYVCKKENM